MQTTAKFLIKNNKRLSKSHGALKSDLNDRPIIIFSPAPGSITKGSRQTNLPYKSEHALCVFACLSKHDVTIFYG